MSGRGRVRFQLLLDQVAASLPPAPARVADAGGGTGQLAVALARRGYTVTVLDTSAAMLATCAERAAGEGPEVAGRVVGVQGDALAAAELLGPASQDAIVCHELVDAVEAPAALLAALGRALRPHGVLSLTFANRDWLALRAGNRGEFAEALRLLDTPGGGEAGQQRGHRAFTAAELRPGLEQAGFELVAALGVGVFAEGRDEDLDPGVLAALLALERRVAGREPYRSSAHIVHLVARRR